MKTSQHYCLPTGPTSRYNFTVHDGALIRSPTRAELAPLQAAIKCTARGLFGASAFELETKRGKLTAVDVTVECGPVRGWGRWPGADHWEVARNGTVIFRTQNYKFLLRYFLNALKSA